MVGQVKQAVRTAALTLSRLGIRLGVQHLGGESERVEAVSSLHQLRGRTCHIDSTYLCTLRTSTAVHGISVASGLDVRLHPSSKKGWRNGALTLLDY